jgi:hypothetical protein
VWAAVWPPAARCLPACLQRWDGQRKSAALAHWRRLLTEKAEAADNLRRCLTRKSVAFRLFRQWYWESFDDDMQVGVKVQQLGKLPVFIAHSLAFCCVARQLRCQVAHASRCPAAAAFLLPPFCYCRCRCSPPAGDAAHDV